MPRNVFTTAGPGRPKGSKNRATIVAEAAALTPRQKILNTTTPLDVIAAAMNYFLEKHNKAVKNGTVDEDAIMKAANFARDAAPYVHARLASNTNVTRTITSISDLTDDELRAMGMNTAPTIEGHSTPGGLLGHEGTGTDE